MARAGLDAAAVTDRAAQMLDEQMLDEQRGEGLSLAALASSLGVKTPSLYKHVDGLRGLTRAVMLRAKGDLGRAMGTAAIGLARGDAIVAMSFAYRRWSLEHPGQYPLTVRAPVAGDDEDERASAAILAVVLAALSGFGLHDDDATDATRFLRSALHGFVSLESTGAFELPRDTELSFTQLVNSVIASLEAQHSSGTQHSSATQ